MPLQCVGIPGPAAIRHIVLFDPKDGTIRHVHSIATFPGAQASSLEHHEAHARKIAEKHGLDAANLRVLHFEGGEQPCTGHKVDVANLRLMKA